MDIKNDIDLEDILNNSKVITIDFDKTLAYYVESGNYGGRSLEVFDRVYDIFKRYQDTKDIYIVTFRSKSLVKEVSDFLNSVKLYPKHIYYTNNFSKTPIIKKLESDIHFDDIPEVLIDIVDKKLKTIPVLVNIESNSLKIFSN